MNIPAPYKIFGDLLIKLRQQAGISQQSELASLIKSTQQTISRWELGLSRPRDKQMPLIASVLKADLNKLLTAAGYSSKVIVPAITYDQPFPIDTLSPDSFERFCFHFLWKHYPEPKDVHRAGGQGHAQDGLDIDVIFPDKACYSFQCKRVKEFGPQKIHKAVADHTRDAQKKYILLSRIASPQSREAIRKHTSWDIWDKEDISLRIRDLPKDDQIKLVDIFFRGQRMALLGETEPGPWQTTAEFFAPFMAGSGAFSHSWNLVGRIDETNAIITGLTNPKILAVFLIGPGGVGKTRVLKEAIEKYELDNKGVSVRFLSSTEEVTNKSLEDLGDRKKVLIVDDAHERNDLPLLFEYAKTHFTNTKILLSFRPYGHEFIKAKASIFAYEKDHICEVKLQALDLERATELASQALKAFDGPESAAKDIARLTRDCSLATVIGAQIVAKEKIHFELAKNEDTFRTTLFGKFQSIIAGDIGKKNESESIKRLLKVIALLQPFHPEDESIVAIVDQIEGISAPEAKRLMRLLVEAGVLFKRGGKYRLSPDLLSDYIIEETCIGPNGRSTGYAEKVFDAEGHTNSLNHTNINNILLNLSKLDWRRANGDPSNSRLLDDIWGKLKPSSEYADPHMSAVASVAYYQPKRALEFADHLIREGKHLKDLPNIIKYAAYNFEHLLHACECLWELGKGDTRELHQTPQHAIRILSELCAVEMNKPLEYNEAVIDFALKLFDQDNAWVHAYSPLDVLKGILQTEGYRSESNGRNIAFHRFYVRCEAVSILREKVINAVISLFSHRNIKIAVLAAHFLHEGLRYPMLGGERDGWRKEFIQTLRKIEKKIKSENLDSLVLIEIARSVNWHANFGQDKTAPIAKRIISLLPDSLLFRTTLALIDGYGHILGYEESKRSAEKWERYLDKLIKELLSTYPDGEQLRSFIEQVLIHIEANYNASSLSSYVLYERLIQLSPSFVQATLQKAMEDPDSKTSQFAGTALSKYLNDDHDNALNIASKFIEIESNVLHAAIGRSYWSISADRFKSDKRHTKILRRLLSSRDQWVVKSATGAIRRLAKDDQHLAIDLLKDVDLALSKEVADDALMLFHRDEEIPFALLTEKDVDHFLNTISPLPELDGYWIETFLSNASKYHPMITADFFMKRVEHAARCKDWGFRPCNHGPYMNVPLRFRESPEFNKLLQRVSQWIKSNTKDDYFFEQRSSELFNVMFSPFDGELIGFLQDWVDEATISDVKIISRIIKEASQEVIFLHRQFVLKFLEKANQFGKDSLDNAISDLYCSASSGTKHGTPGEPFPEDVRTKNETERALKEIPRFSPAYRLFEYLKKDAERNIKRSLEDREAFED